MSRKLLLSLLFLLLVGVGFFLYRRLGGQPQTDDNLVLPHQSQTLEIGVVLPLSGSMAEYGENGRNGLTLAKEDLGQQGIAVELRVHDTKERPEDTVTVVRRLIDVENVKFIIGGLTSSGVLAAAPYAQEKNVLFFSPAASAPGIPEIGDMIFRNWQSDTALAEKFGEFAYQKLGLRRLAILYISNDYGQTNSQTFAATIRKLGGEILLERAFPQGTSNFRDLITRVRSERSLDAIFLVGYPDEYRGLFDEIERQQINLKILTTDTFYTPSMPLDVGSIAEGVVCAVASKPEDDYKPRREFINRYRARFNKDPGLVSDTAYDALMLVTKGIRATDGTPKSLSQWLLKLRDYEGVAGLTTFTETGDFRGGMAVYEVKNGEFVPVI